MVGGTFTAFLGIPVRPAEIGAFQGDVVCLRVFSQVIVVLSSLSAVKDLLEMRGEYYSERPYRPMLEMCVLYRISLPICRHVDSS